jgi:hypothetical protein
MRFGGETLASFYIFFQAGSTIHSFNGPPFFKEVQPDHQDLESFHFQLRDFVVIEQHYFIENGHIS